jgi:hypothetical protein
MKEKEILREDKIFTKLMNGRNRVESGGKNLNPLNAWLAIDRHILDHIFGILCRDHLTPNCFLIKRKEKVRRDAIMLP